MDEPDLIVNEAINNHRSMIKQFKGLPSLLLKTCSKTVFAPVYS
jgi:hypothetical protein